MTESPRIRGLDRRDFLKLTDATGAGFLVASRSDPYSAATTEPAWLQHERAGARPYASASGE